MIWKIVKAQIDNPNSSVILIESQVTLLPFKMEESMDTSTCDNSSSWVYHVMAMLKERILEFLKSWYNDFLPFWKWRIPVAKKKTNHHYGTVVSCCRISQYCLAAWAVLFTVAFDRSRQLLISAAFLNDIPIFLLDILTYVILGYLLGIKRFPANYISLVIIKAFVVLDEKFNGELYKFEVKVLSRSRNNGYWSVLTASPRATPPLIPEYIRHTIIIFAALVIIATCIKLFNITMSKYKENVVICQTVATTAAAVLLVSTFSFGVYPDFKEFHIKVCELWVLFGSTTLVVVMAFLLERVQYELRGKWKANFTSRVDWESYIFILAFCITIRCLPVIHKGFSVRDILERKTLRLLEFVIPADIINLWNYVTT